MELRQSSPKPSFGTRWGRRFLLGIGAAEFCTLCGLALLGSDLVTNMLDSFSDSHAQSTAVSALSGMLSVQQQMATRQAERIESISPRDATQMASELSGLAATQQALQEALIQLSPSPNESTPRATPPPVSPVLFTDNFDAGLSPDWQVRSGTPVVVNDRLTASEPTWLIVGTPSWSDYVVDLWGDASHCWASENENVVAVRVVDFENFIAFRWADCETAWFEVRDGTWSEIPNSRSGGAGYEMVHLRILVEGSKFSAYTGDERLSSFFSNAFPAGMVALRLEAKTQVDDFTIR